MDMFNKSDRSAVMRSVKSKNTGAEMKVRQLLHAAGFRYFLHVKNLPGKPDIVFPRRKKAIFVHGCFWHQHPGCRSAHRPASNSDYWNAKLDRNMARDERNLAILRESGWEIFVVWECDIRDQDTLLETLKSFLG